MGGLGPGAGVGGPGLVARSLIAAVRFYQLARGPFVTSKCRFTPSCSVYAEGSVREHGAIKGSWLAARRLARCHPLGGCGFDPVPTRTVPVGAVPAEFRQRAGQAGGTDRETERGGR